MLSIILAILVTLIAFYAGTLIFKEMNKFSSEQYVGIYGNPDPDFVPLKNNKTN